MTNERRPTGIGPGKAQRSGRASRARARPREGDDPDDAPLYTDDDNRPVLSGYRSMWLFAMFDLPVTNKVLRKRYARFRKDLLGEGFTMLQYSVYARHCPSEESAATIRARVRSRLPDEGQVRVMGVTDRQFGKMEVYFGKSRRRTEPPPVQFMLF